MILLDSHIIIYLVQKQHQALRQWLLTIQPAYSISSKVAVLGYWKLSSQQTQNIQT